MGKTNLWRKWNLKQQTHTNYDMANHVFLKTSNLIPFKWRFRTYIVMNPWVNFQPTTKNLQICFHSNEDLRYIFTWIHENFPRISQLSTKLQIWFHFNEYLKCIFAYEIMKFFPNLTQKLQNLFHLSEDVKYISAHKFTKTSQFEITKHHLFFHLNENIKYIFYYNKRCPYYMSNDFIGILMIF
jgi:hypothetical protein